MVLSCWYDDTIIFINKEGVISSQIGKDKTGSYAYDSVYIKDNNSVAVSSGFGVNRCIAIIDIVSNEFLTTISMDTHIFGMAIRSGSIYYCAGKKGLKLLNISDKSVRDIITRDMTFVYYVATYRILFYLYLSVMISPLLY
jgi:hypothetical protein